MKKCNEKSNEKSKEKRNEKRNEKSNEQNKEVTNRVTNRVTNEQLYEGLICLDVKLSKLVDVLDKIYAMAEQKHTGGNNTLREC